MKRVAKFIFTLLFAVTCLSGYAQIYTTFRKQLSDDEKIKEIMTSEDFKKELESKLGGKQKMSPTEWYSFFLEKARRKYPNVWVDIINIKGENDGWGNHRVPVTCEVVYKVNPQDQWLETLSQGMERAFRNVREGSRMAIDQVTAVNGVDKEEIKDKVIDVLLDKGYKVVAKEFLERLQKEQQQQQSGVFNDNTTVQENNFSAVGYFVNVKISESSVRIQVINVSTGEYEGNTTINF